MKNKNKHIYLDYNATAPLRPEARKALLTLIDGDNYAHNASSVHNFGRAGRRIIEQAREQVATIIGADTNQVLFNSGATEGNNTVLRHFSAQYPNDYIIVSGAEHPSTSEVSHYHDRVLTIPLLTNGLTDLDALDNMLEEHKNVSLISCMHVSNETGSIQNVSDISKKAHKSGALMHCDATQSVGRIPVDMKGMGIDFLTFSSHKIGGPQGVGALALGMCGQTPTLIYGGGQEKSARAGTENIAGIAAFGAAAKAALSQLDDYQNLTVMRDRLETELKDISPDIVIHGEDAPRVANTSFFSLPGTNSQSLLMALDLDKIAVSNGSACSSGTVKPSKTLESMGHLKETTNSALRISMGWATKGTDIDAFLNAWQKIISRIK